LKDPQAVEIWFRNKDIQKLCEQQKQATRKLGAACAEKLIRRLQEMEAAACVGELIAGRPHSLTGDRTGQFAFDLAGGRRLTFSAGEPCPMLADGSIDWSRVAIICIEYIGDYHD